MTTNKRIPIAGITIQDATHVLEKIQGVEGVVLIGGQALNFWAERYRRKDPFLSNHGPFTTRDVDFWAGKEEAQQCADRLGGTLTVPDIDDHTPNTGLLILEQDVESPVTIDFMGDIQGVSAADVEATSVEVEVNHVRFRVMHPLLCLESRLANCFGLLHREDPHSIDQLRVAVRVLHRYLSEILDQGEERRALNIAEKVGRMANRDAAKEAFVHYQVDVLAAVPFEAFPSAAFREVRWPQIRAQVDRKRATYAALLESRSRVKRSDVDPR